MLSLEYRLYNNLGVGAWITAYNEVSSRFQNIDFEAIHNNYEDIEISSTSNFSVSGVFSDFIRQWLIYDANRSVNSIECRIRYTDDGCDFYFRDYAYIRYTDVQPISVNYDGELITKDCLEVRMKFERLKIKALLINTIDTDKIQNPDLVNGHVNFTLAYPHPQIHYQVDNSNGYFWAMILFLLIYLIGMSVGVALLFGVTLPAGIAVLAGITLIYTLVLAIPGLDRYFIKQRGSQYSVLSPFHKDYLDNIVLTNGLTGLTDHIFTAPSKLPLLHYATFFNTAGILHPTIADVEWDRLNMANDIYLRWVNDRFNAKWRLIGSKLHIVPKSEDYYTPIDDFRFIDFEWNTPTDPPNAAANYLLKEDYSENKSTTVHKWYSDDVSFTGNQTNPSQKGTLERNYLDAGAAFRNNGLEEDDYSDIDRVYNALISIPVIGALLDVVTGIIANFFQIGKSDGDYLFTKERITTAPKLVVVDSTDTTKAIKKPYTAAEISYAVNKEGYDGNNFNAASFNYNYVVPCDEVLNSITPNCFSLQNDDPRITKKEGTRKYVLKLCCDKLRFLGLLDDPTSTPDIAVDFEVLILGIDNTIDFGEIKRIKFNFGTKKIEVDVERKLKV